MRIKHAVATTLVLCTSLAAQAQVVLTQGFDNVPALSGAGWTFVNSSPSPGNNWFQGNAGIFPSASGADDSYVAANFLGTTAASGPVSNWLITPRLLLDATSTVSFVARVAGQGFLDRVDVLLSTTGTAAGDFALLGSYSSSADNGWVAQSFSANLSAATASYVAFRYVVADVATAGSYLGIDNLSITAVPEPTSTVLLGLGLAGVLARRRLFA